MTPDRWTRIKDLFAQAAALPPGERAAFLGAACRTDDEPDDALRQSLEAMLAQDDAGDVLASLAGPPAPPPERVGPWRLVERVGEGGMGEVWRAERADGAYDQTAAVKLVRPGLATDLLARFRAERQVLARLDHPAIARLLDGGTASDGRPYLALEYVDGEPITDYADRRRLGVDARLALFAQVCEAVAAAHRQLVVHRDLKPSNVLVTDDGQVKLLDFGIAKLLDPDPEFTVAVTAAERRVMTPEYAAPEQVRGEPATTATDVYGLGVLLYELLTGARPYRLESRIRRAVERAILEAEPTQPSTAVTDADAARARSTEPAKLCRRLRGDLDQIVLRALRKEPERRYDGAAAFAADLARHRDGLPVEARPESAVYRAGRFVRRHRVGVIAAAAVALAVVVGAGLALWQAAEADRQRAAASREAAASAQVATFMTDLFRESNSAEVRGDTVSARDLLDQGLARIDSLAETPDVQADLLDVLGEIYGRLGRFEQAQQAFTRVVEIRRQQGDSLSVVAALAALAAVRDDERAFPEAIEIYRTALARARDARAPDSLRAALHLGLGEALVQNDDLAGAIRALDAATGFADRTFPADAPQAQSIRSLRAKVLVRQEDYAGARRLYERNIRQLRANDPSSWLAGELNSLAFAFKRSGDPAAAVPLYQEALSILERTDREGHRDRSVLLSNLAAAAYEVGDVQTAERSLVEKLDLETTYQEPGHWRIGSANGSLADFYERQGRSAPSLWHWRQQVEIYTAALGPGHSWTATAHASLGLTLLSAGDAPGAGAEFDACARALHERLAGGDPFDLDTKNSLARLIETLDERGLPQRAQAFRELLAAGS